MSEKRLSKQRHKGADDSGHDSNGKNEERYRLGDSEKIGSIVDLCGRVSVHFMVSHQTCHDFLTVCICERYVPFDAVINKIISNL